MPRTMQEHSMRAGWGPPITDAEHERITGFLVETRSDDDEDGRDRDDHDPGGLAA